MNHIASILSERELRCAAVYYPLYFYTIRLISTKFGFFKKTSDLFIAFFLNHKMFFKKFLAFGNQLKLAKIFNIVEIINFKQFPCDVGAQSPDAYCHCFYLSVPVRTVGGGDQAADKTNILEQAMHEVTSHQGEQHSKHFDINRFRFSPLTSDLQTTPMKLSLRCPVR